MKKLIELLQLVQVEDPNFVIEIRNVAGVVTVSLHWRVNGRLHTATQACPDDDLSNLWFQMTFEDLRCEVLASSFSSEKLQGGGLT